MKVDSVISVRLDLCGGGCENGPMFRFHEQGGVAAAASMDEGYPPLPLPLFLPQCVCTYGLQCFSSPAWWSVSKSDFLLREREQERVAGGKTWISTCSSSRRLDHHVCVTLEISVLLTTRSSPTSFPFASSPTSLPYLLPLSPVFYSPSLFFLLSRVKALAFLPCLPVASTSSYPLASRLRKEEQKKERKEKLNKNHNGACLGREAPGQR